MSRIANEKMELEQQRNVLLERIARALENISASTTVSAVANSKSAKLAEFMAAGVADHVTEARLLAVRAITRDDA